MPTGGNGNRAEGIAVLRLLLLHIHPTFTPIGVHLGARLSSHAPPFVAPLVPPYATLGGACSCWHPDRMLTHYGSSVVVT